MSPTYAYTANAELTTKTVGAQVTSYTYDALDNLLHESWSNSVWVGGRAVR